MCYRTLVSMLLPVGNAFSFPLRQHNFTDTLDNSHFQQAQCSDMSVINLNQKCLGPSCSLLNQSCLVQSLLQDLNVFLTVGPTFPPTRKPYSMYKLSLNLREAHVCNSTFHSKTEIFPVFLMGSNLKGSLKYQTNPCFLKKVILSQVEEETNRESHTIVTRLQFQPAHSCQNPMFCAPCNKCLN